MIRAVLDVNVLVSANDTRTVWFSSRSSSDGGRRSSSAISSGGIEIELEKKLWEDRIGEALRFSTSPAVFARIQLLLSTKAEFVVVPSQAQIPIMGDPDDYVLVTCSRAQAYYLVTGDDGLLGLTQHGETRVVSPREVPADSGHSTRLTESGRPREAPERLGSGGRRSHPIAAPLHHFNSLSRYPAA